MDFKVEGLEDLERSIGRLKAAARQEADNTLKKGGMKIVAESQKNLRKEPNSNNTGALSNSGRVRKGGELSYEAGFEISYAEYVENGRLPGKMPPVKMIAEWAKKKLRVDDRSKMSVGFVIARKIAASGTKAKHFFSEAVEKVTKTIRDDLQGLITKAERKV